jgi:aminoglycoside phosphotransferase (APT) family kinase protein
MVITKEIEGESFLKILEQKSLSEISSALKKSAKWLKKLHKTPLYSFRDVFSPSYSLAYWQEQLRILRKGFPNKLKFLKKLINEILDWENQNRKNINLAITHHDFHPKNIFLGKRRIWVLDFSESRLSKPVIDVLTFLCQLDLINRNEIKRFSQRKLREFSEIFLREYFGQKWKEVLKDPALKRDFIILKKRIALQALVGSLLFNQKPKIFLDIIFGKSN